MITTVGSIAALTSALATAQAGDTILLAAGSYGKLSINGVHFASNVTIASETPGGASINGLAVANSNGLTFRDIEFIADPAGGTTPQSVVASQDITFDRARFHGSLDGDPTNDTGGLFIRVSTNIKVSNSEFNELYWGINHVDSKGLTLAGNTFHDLRMDGIRGGGSSSVTITANSFRDFYPVSGDHSDAIQFWTSGTATQASDIVITNNLIVRGGGQPPQGVFMRDEVGNLPFQNVTITGNMVAGALYNGIHVNGGLNVIVAGNVVDGFSDQKSWISLNNITGGQLTNNATTLINNGSALANVAESGTVLLTPAVDDGAAIVTQWLSVRGTDVSASIYANTIGPPTPGQSIQGDLGPNRLSSGSGNDTVSGQLGDDTITDTGGSNYLRGDDGNDAITGGSGFDDINGNAGADTVRGGGGDDWVVGGKDNDVVAGEGGNDLVYGNLGDDSCDGGDGNDIVRGGQGDDQVKGNNGDDYLSGDKGNDTMIGGAGADTFHSFGDAGIDRVMDFSLAQGDRVLLDIGTSYTVGQVGADTVIDMAGGGQMILVGVSTASLTGNWLVVG